MREGLKKIIIPVTIMMGVQSEVFPNEGVLYLDEQIPQSKIIKFKRSGHALFLTEPVKFLRELKQFLNDYSKEEHPYISQFINNFLECISDCHI